MMKRAMLCTLLLGALALWAAPQKPAEKTPAESGIVAKAQALVDALAKGDYPAATKDFDAAMKGALSPEKLGETWKQLQLQAGAYKGRTGVRQEKYQQYDIVYVACTFAAAPLEAKVVFDPQGFVAGLFFVPAQAPAGSATRPSM